MKLRKLDWSGKNPLRAAVALLIWEQLTSDNWACSFRPTRRRRETQSHLICDKKRLGGLLAALRKRAGSKWRLPSRRRCSCSSLMRSGVGSMAAKKKKRKTKIGKHSGGKKKKQRSGSTQAEKKKRKNKDREALRRKKKERKNKDREALRRKKKEKKQRRKIKSKPEHRGKNKVEMRRH